MELKNRLQYLDKLISVQDMEVIKVVTGSNAYPLSSELSTYLSGRYVEIKMPPLSFREFLDFHGYLPEEYKAPNGSTKQRVKGKGGEAYELRAPFEAYAQFGGMPALAEAAFNHSILSQQKSICSLRESRSRT